ncbi:unnamed protein product, partial [marine sediment metagenome]
KMDTEQAEIFATVFAAWNDLLLQCRPATDTDVIREVRENWHESKVRFKAHRLGKAIEWMRTHSFVPRGLGPATSPTTG